MTRVLWMSHTADKGGAELFLIDVLAHSPVAWSGCFLGPGPAVGALEALGRRAHVLEGGASLLGVTRGASPARALQGAMGMIGVARELATVMAGYDVLFANSQKSLFVGALACAIARKPLVWVLHDIITDPSFSRANRAAAVGVANRFAKAVVVNSKATAESFTACGGRAGLVRLVYNGFDVERPPAAPVDVRQAFGFDARPVVGLFSRLSAWKGQHILLEALKDAPDVQALLVGGALFGQDAYEKSLHAQVEALGLADRVRFAGFRNDVPQLMADVDVVLHTSTHVEPFGRVVVEGMLAGKPVIATAGGGVDEIIDREDLGLLVPPDDPTALAAAINRLVGDTALRGRLAKAGNTSARARFDLRTSCAQLVELAEEVSAR